MSSSLFDSYDLGGLRLPNRIVMAPLTRSRAGAGLVPGPHAADYYRQRASAGLIIAEATQISAEAQGYQDTPGIYTPEQIAGWRRVTDAVHEDGGRIFLQIWHVGRISHVAFQPGRRAPVAPSALQANVKIFADGSFQPASPPRAIDLAEIPGIIEDFRRAAANAMAAGFDGIEVHGANGYLLDQFASDGTNQRKDAYGGSVENRARLMLEATAAVVAEVGAERTGLRLSPISPGNDMQTSDPAAQYGHIVSEIDAMGLVYLHVIEGATGGARDNRPFDFAALRQSFRGTWIGNNGYDLGLAEQQIASGAVDLVAFGRPFISNPDLVARLKAGAELTAADPSTFYGGGAEGYSDYPAMPET